jgi:exopolysaccharide production protein ExoY
MSNTPANQSRTENLTGSTIRPWKRAIDLIGCVLALPLLVLLTLVMTIVTRLFSPGPVLFRQVRVGYLGQRFTIYKFRSMHLNTDATRHQNHFRGLVGTNAPMEKLDTKGDPSLIPGAWLMRASGLDELPQIINVFRGDMSLIGPRPCLPAEEALYQPWQRERFNSLPGLTGLWQVSGKNRTTFNEMIMLDIHYARTLSCWTDFKILLLTVPTLLMQVYETKIGRRLSVVSAHTAAPFIATQNRQP